MKLQTRNCKLQFQVCVSQEKPDAEGLYSLSLLPEVYSLRAGEKKNEYVETSILGNFVARLKIFVNEGCSLGNRGISYFSH